MICKETASAELSGPLRLRVQSRSRTRLRIAASIAFLFCACFKGVLDTIAPFSAKTPFFFGKELEEKIHPKIHSNSSNRNLVSSRPKSTLQGSALDDLRFSVRITNRNGNHISRFGALSSGVLVLIPDMHISRARSSVSTICPETWAHANGGIINGSVACVSEKKERFYGFLHFFVRFCVSLLPKWSAEKHKLSQNCAKMGKKRFFAIPPLYPLLRVTERQLRKVPSVPKPLRN